MTLADLENAVLLQLQEGNVTFGIQPVYATGANYSQATVDWAINRGYGKLLDDLGDISIVTETIKFPSVTGVYSYPVPIAQAASGTLTTRLAASGMVAGIVLTTTVNGTAVTYTTKSTDGALTALTQLAANVNANALVTAATPALTAMQQNLNGQSIFNVQAFTPGLAGNSITFTASSSNSAVLSIAASGSGFLAGGTAESPNIRVVRSVSYQPLGLTYDLYREAGVRLVSWKEYQRKLVSGYAQYFSAGQQPDLLAMNTTRTKLHTYPTPYNSGDTITVDYCPQLTSNVNVPATNWGYLAASSDAPPSMLPEDAQDCIWLYACFLLWPKSREIGTAQLYLKMYQDKMRETKENYMGATQGDQMGIRDRGDLVAASFGWSNR